MAAKKEILLFSGFEEMIKKIEKAGGTAEKAVTAAVKEDAEWTRQQLLDFIKKHKETGATEASLIPVVVESYRGKISCKVGFSISNGGLAAVFLNYGTPKIAPTLFIDKAFKNKKKHQAIQEEAMQKILREIGG